mmetsp:Transcript_76859/g.154168  ORF Transcript_76859/g.154168 Transcript_76859/m.154168 type:complete len:101 (+) Transcript_76859:109-411(+)
MYSSLSHPLLKPVFGTICLGSTNKATPTSTTDTSNFSVDSTTGFDVPSIKRLQRLYYNGMFLWHMADLKDSRRGDLEKLAREHNAKRRAGDLQGRCDGPM